ncbi:MAG TPA: hypothetical protein VGX00_08345 [Thermoplasmata archaeon]|nr:hypothetical protein [Thermoplasmata archaeon]
MSSVGVYAGAPYRLPSRSGRLAWGLLRALPLAAFYVGGPFLAKTLTDDLGVPFPFDFTTVLLVGLGLLALSTAKFVAKPTRLYGPVSLVYAAALLAYLWWLAAGSSLRVVWMGATIAVTFADLVLLLAVVPAFMILGAIATTIEDAARPRERYPLDFPA